MEPTLLEGDRLVVLSRPWGARSDRCRGTSWPCPTHVTPVRMLVKRVARWTARRGPWRSGATQPAPAPTAATFGPVPLASVVGRVVYRYGPPGRSGPLGRSTEYHRA